MKFSRGYYDTFVKTCGKYPSNIAVRVYENKAYKCYTYSEMYGVCEYIAQTLQQFQCSKSVIGLVSKGNMLVPCVIAAAHKCCDSFMFLDPTQDIDNIAQDMKFSLVISVFNADTNTVSDVLSRTPDKVISVFGFNISFYNYTSPTEQLYKQIGYSFIAMTSGSTGDPKKIQVPINCIQPNIDDLTKMFQITSKDVIYFSTPLTFDPSMIEIQLACMNGASLLIAPEIVEAIMPENKNHRQHAVTVWQTTPSLFFQLSNSAIKKLLKAKSPLRILALGGEPFNGLNRLRQLKDKDNKTRIFALYGVTEMSCWACAAEIDLDKVSTDREVPLGNCLSETEVMLRSDNSDDTSGRIILVSKTRNCMLLNRSSFGDKNCLKFVDTGDIGEMKNGTIYYRGRTDDMIKRFGYKINLQLIESTIMHCPRIKACSCIWLPKPRLLVVYFSSETFSSQDLSDFLKCKLDDKHWPDKIIRVNNLPTNAHGKITRAHVTRSFDGNIHHPITFNSLKAKFLMELRDQLSQRFTYDEIKDKDFFSIGGTSFLAVSLCNKLSQTDAGFGKCLLPHLMSPMKNISQIIETVGKELNENVVQQDKAMKDIKKLKRAASESVASSSESAICKKSTATVIPVQLAIFWTYNTNKCVDASPTLLRSDLNLYVCVGSHSGRIVAIDVMSGVVQCMIRVKSRVEAAVYCYDKNPSQKPVGIVGAYDGTIVCFVIEDGEERWRVNVGSMIKSKATVCNGFVYVASYDGVIRRLDFKTGAVKDVIVISPQPISADLVLAKDKYILTATLSGVCASINSETNMVAWRTTLNSPVFASPALYDNDRYVVFAEVNGEIHCRTVEKGIKIWSFLGVKGNVFSSFYITEVEKMKWQLVIGCHDHNVYSIHVKNCQPVLQWKTELSSPIYSTPCGLNENLLLAASNNGRLCVISKDGTILLEFHLPNETFSSPATYQDYIFIGCRNDFLYALLCVIPNS